MTETIGSSTRPIDPKLVALLRGLKPGDRIRVTHALRVGRHHWTAVTEGAFRDVNYLSTGLATHRPPEDEIIVAAVHFTKDNRELSSITIDEHTRIEKLA